MKTFMGKNFLLSNDVAKALYHDVAAKLPIIDYHCHVSPKEIAEDKRYSNITELWLGGDHYSIADIAAWPWVNCHVRQRIDLANYPAVHNWYERIKQRPATAEAMLKIQLY